MNSTHPGAGLSPETARVDLTATNIHNATSDRLAMSARGPPEHSGINLGYATSQPGSDEAGFGDGRASETMSVSPISTNVLQRPHPQPHATTDRATQTVDGGRAPVEMRAHFEDFAAQLRLHRHNEYKRRMLEHRRRHLQKAVALSGRLQRLSSWVHDGLVEISINNQDASSFVRVQQHMQDLTDVCVSQWDHEIQALDPVNSPHSTEAHQGSDSFVDKLSPDGKRECLEFFHLIRSNPRYLIDRFKAVSPAQLSALSTSPRYQKLSTSILASLSQNSGRSSQKRQRIQSYAKSLEHYASSFERKHAITFLLYNCFGSDDAERGLRLSTWASICAGLYQESRPAFSAIIHQVLGGFVPLGRWPARERFHLFLMDVLQRGAFLVEPFDGNGSTSSLQSTFSELVETEQTREFFDAAVAQLFDILAWEGGIPLMALDLARAIIGKLDDVHLQMEFRSFFFFDWYLGYFLQIALNYPENEEMLLHFHISEPARQKILVQLHQRANVYARLVPVSEPEQTIDSIVKHCVQTLIGQVHEIQVENPYAGLEERPASITTITEPESISSLTLCADDVIQVLDALSQQYTDLFLSSSQMAFNSQYPTANTGFTRLRRELLVLQEPGFSSTSIHPCQERWLVLPIMQDGKLGRPESTEQNGGLDLRVSEAVFSQLGAMDAVQKAAVRLVLEDPSNDGPPNVGESLNIPRQSSLVECFGEKARNALNAADNVDGLYWSTALKTLASRYPSAAWGRDDSRVLRPLLHILGKANADSFRQTKSQIAALEEAYVSSKKSLVDASRRLHKLKVRMWYRIGVINSAAYEEAKNIARALNYMALPVHGLPESTYSVASERTRPGTSTSTASSMFEQTRVDTMHILKAPKEHGGSKKLADEQVEMTKRWLDRSNVENFCKGEERIHRFCMEIKMATRKLVADTLAESPVLWASDLWAKEKVAYDVGTTAPFSVPGSTRPPSVMSETLSSTIFSTRPPLVSQSFSSRSLDADTASSQGRKGSLYSMGSGRLNRELFGSELAASLSPGRSLTATSGESVSSIWSPLPSQSRSATSYSGPSRAPSIITDFASLRLGDTSLEKAKFLDELQHDLISLLLSDLGNPVWGHGSETDTWISSARENSNLTKRLRRQQQISRLVPASLHDAGPAHKKSTTRANGKRRTWSADTLQKGSGNESRIENPEGASADQKGLPDYSMMAELQDVLDRISHHIDPRMKLDTVHDFKVLALQAYPQRSDTVEGSRGKKGTSPGTRPRRQSLGPGVKHQPPAKAVERPGPETEDEIVEYLKNILLALKHKTLFRDLQYIAAFIPSDTLNKTEKGRAFLHLGLSALSCKDEYCRTMVDLADTIVAKDGIKRRVADIDSREEGLVKAKEYWILAAREGNRIAQRELAGLYLAHPEVPPVVSLPLSLSSEIFKNEMMWQEQSGQNTNTQALCLARHWMQQAAENGDQVAQQKLEERKGSTSLR